MSLKGYLKKIPHLNSISSIARKNKVGVWLVGGFLRDVYLKKNKQFIDFDFCVEKNTFKVVKEFSKKISSKFIVLDKVNESLRVILKKKNIIYTYDFTLMRGKDIKEDIYLRDFTINTLAMSLNEKKPKIIDFFNAKKDLNSKVIKVVSSEVLPQDPLRILRGFSFMVNYGFKIENKTLKLMEKYKSGIKKVSGERINEELFKILGSDNSYSAISLMDKINVIDELIAGISAMRGIGQGGFHHLDVWNHSLETLRQFELFYRKVALKNKDFFQYLNQELIAGHKLIQIIKLACILHDVGKPQAKIKLNKRTIFHTHEKIGRDLAGKIADKLRLSLREKETLKKLIFWHLRPGYLADQITPSKRAIYRFFRDTQNDGAAVIFLSFSDWRATRGLLINFKKRKRHEKIMLDLLKKNFANVKKKPLPVILDGCEIMEKFHLESGPLIGTILKKVKEEQALGKIHTKIQAYKEVRKIIRQAKIK